VTLLSPHKKKKSSGKVCTIARFTRFTRFGGSGLPTGGGSGLPQKWRRRLLLLHCIIPIWRKKFSFSEGAYVLYEKFGVGR
jgi:hypothetical protein